MAASAALMMLMVVLATSAAVSAVTTSATAAQVSHHVLNLLRRRLAVLQNGTFEVQCLACQRMVQVYLDLVFAHCDDTTVEALPLLIL